MANLYADTLEEIFSQLSPEQEERLVALPYRVGLFVSFSDTTGGWEAQEKELQSLTAILREFSQDLYTDELSQKILLDCLNKRAQWPAFSHQIDSVPGEAAALMKILSAMVLPATLEPFGRMLRDVALAVAMAFRENGRDDDDAAQNASPSVKVRDIITRLVGSRTAKDPLEHMNISPQERIALLRLQDALENEI